MHIKFRDVNINQKLNFEKLMKINQSPNKVDASPTSLETSRTENGGRNRSSSDVRGGCPEDKYTTLPVMAKRTSKAQDYQPVVA